jgi:hypothetical protein
LLRCWSSVGADSLGTALDLTLKDILMLADVVVLRTVLNFFLGRELREAAEREGSPQQAAACIRHGAPDAPEGQEIRAL